VLCHPTIRVFHAVSSRVSRTGSRNVATSHYVRINTTTSAARDSISYDKSRCCGRARLEKIRRVGELRCVYGYAFWSRCRIVRRTYYANVANRCSTRLDVRTANYSSRRFICFPFSRRVTRAHVDGPRRGASRTHCMFLFWWLPSVWRERVYVFFFFSFFYSTSAKRSFRTVLLWNNC